MIEATSRQNSNMISSAPLNQTDDSPVSVRQSDPIASNLNIRQRIDMIVEDGRIEGIEIEDAKNMSDKFGITDTQADILIQREGRLSETGERINDLNDKLNDALRNTPNDTERIENLRERKRSLMYRFESLYDRTKEFVHRVIITPITELGHKLAETDIDQDFFEDREEGITRGYFHVLSLGVLDRLNMKTGKSIREDEPEPYRKNGTQP